MDLIQMARALGAQIQQDERYLSFMAAHNANERDEELSELIGRVQLVHMSYRHEAAKADANQQKLSAYDEEFSGLYKQVMAHPLMQQYEAARDEFDALMKKITGILALCARGEDPQTCEPEDKPGCGGDCGGCAGCGE